MRKKLLGAWPALDRDEPRRRPDNGEPSTRQVQNERLALALRPGLVRFSVTGASATGAARLPADSGSARHIFTKLYMREKRQQSRPPRSAFGQPAPCFPRSHT
jgi:hypothetical protein